jgi:hypothetical protein
MPTDRFTLASAMPLWRQALCVLALASTCSCSPYFEDPNARIAIDPFDDYTIRQRVDHFGSMPISGTVAGKVSSIEARIIDAQSGATVIDWRKIDAVIEGGKWQAMIGSIPEGGWYNVHVRSARNHGITAESDRRFGIGAIIVFTGQSNLFANIGNPYKGDAREEWKDSDLSAIISNHPPKHGQPAWALNKANVATFYRLVGSNLAQRLQIPVGLVNAAWGGTRIFDWTNETQKVKDDEDAVFERYQSMIRYAGGDTELLVWHQGWSDFGPIVKTPTHYEEQLDKLYGRLTREISRDNVPIVCGVEGRRIPHEKKELLADLDKLTLAENKWANYARWSQMRWAKKHDYVFKGPNTIDIRLNDHSHFDSNDRILWASRMTQCILFALGEETYGGGGPDIDPRSCVIEGDIITLKVKHEGGDKLVVPFPNKPIEGFVVSDDNFKSRLDIEKIEIIQPDTIKIVLKKTPSKEVQLTYLAGPSPIVDILLDPNSEVQEAAKPTPPGNILYDNAKLPPGNIRPGLGLMVNGAIGPLTAAQRESDH